MSSLSSLLTNIAKQDGNKSLMENLRGGQEEGETGTTDNMKIRVMNMQEYKAKKFMEERKNTKAWDGKTNKTSSNNANTNKKKKNTNKKEQQQTDENSKENKKETENKPKLYRPPIKAIMQQKETKKEELFPDLMQVKKTNKTEKEKEKEKSKSQNKNAKKNKKDKDKVDGEAEEQKNEIIYDTKEIEKIKFNIYDIVDIKKEYEPIARNLDKVMEKYKNRNYDEFISCN